MNCISKINLISLIIVVIALFSCSKEKDYPPEPVIEYKNFIYDNNAKEGNLIIGFTDGDGDIGLKPDQNYPPYDSSSIYHYNFYIHIFKKVNGTYLPFVIFNTSTQQNDTIVFKYRIQYIEPVSANGSLKGELNTKMDIGLMLPYLNNDTVLFKAYIYDRALHKSNIINTSDLKF